MTGMPTRSDGTAAAATGRLAVAIVGRETGWHAQRIAMALGARGHDVTHVGWEALASSLEPGGETLLPRALARADVVCVRGMPGVPTGPDRLERVVFRMDVLGRLAGGGTPVVNAPRALEAAIDKYLASSRIAAAGLRVPRTRVVQGETAALAAWDALGGDCVVKPLFGSQGKGVERVQSRTALARWLGRPAGPGPDAVVYIQEFLGAARWDARILLVGDRLFAMRRTAPAGEWRTNLAVGGRAERFDPPPAWAAAARIAADTLGTAVAGVDLLPAPDGSPIILEVNAVPGWRGLEAATGLDVTEAVADHLEEVGRRVRQATSDD